MSLGVTKTRIYLNIRDGKIYLKDQPFDFIEGYLKGIQLRDREFRGETVKYWYIDIESPEGELYSLALSYSSGVAKSLFNSLASAHEFKDQIKIMPYQVGDFTKVTTYIGAEKLSWKYSTLPPIDTVMIGGRPVKDDSKRMQFIENLVNEINGKI